MKEILYFMKKSIGIIKRNKEVFVILIASILYLIYCNWTMMELPNQSWFDFLPIVNKYFDHSLKFTDMLYRYCEHGMFGYNIILLINVYLFHLTTMFDVYLNVFIVIIAGFLFVYSIKKHLDDKNISYLIGVILIAINQFTFIQKASGAMETQVRLGILFFIISTIFVNDVFINYKNLTNKKILIVYLLIIISINVFGTFYNFAGLPAICIAGILLIIKKNTPRLKIGSIIICYLLATIIYIFEYDIFGSNGAVNSSSQINNIISIFKHPIENFKALLGYNGCGIFGSAVFLDGKISNDIYLIIGIIITLIVFFALYQYFKLKMYTITYLPVFLIAFSFGVFIFVIIGRANYDWTWCLNEWYIVNSKIQYIGVIYILIYYYQNSSKSYIRKYIFYIFSLAFFIIAAAGNFYEIKRAPNIEAYFKEKQPYLFAESKEELPVDENGMTPLLASADMTYQSIEILRKYGLSVYRYYPIYEKYKQEIKIVDSILYNGKVLESKGYYEDKWIGKEAELIVYTDLGGLSLKLYCPFPYDGTQKGTIYINGMEYKKYSFEQEELIIPVEFTPKSKVVIKFVNDFVKISPPDTRELSFVLEVLK